MLNASFGIMGMVQKKKKVKKLWKRAVFVTRAVARFKLAGAKAASARDKVRGFMSATLANALRRVQPYSTNNN